MASDGRSPKREAQGLGRMDPDDDQSDELEDDPRWEVQPVVGREDDAGGIAYPMLVALVAGAGLAGLLIWLMSGPSLGS